LTCLGPLPIQLLLLPNLAMYGNALQQTLNNENSSEIVKLEVQKCFEALKVLVH